MVDSVRTGGVFQTQQPQKTYKTQTNSTKTQSAGSIFANSSASKTSAVTTPSASSSANKSDGIGRAANIFSGIGKLLLNSVDKMAASTSIQSVTTNSGIYRAETPVLVANTPLEGDVKTGKAASDALDNMLATGKGEITVTSNEWRELAAKKDKTPEDIQKLDTEYNTNMKKLGNSMAQYISQAFANGGDIDSAAFMKFQSSGAMDLSGLTQDEIAQLKTSNEIAFKRIDQNGDGKIDSKEMSAYMMAMDFDENNRMGGSIKAEDYINNASQLDDPNKNLLDQKLAYSYNKLYGDEEN